MASHFMNGMQPVAPDTIRYIMVPGRGRTLDGTGLTIASKLRVIEAARVFKELEIEAKGGAVVVSGYKSPADRSGKKDVFLKGYMGIPEADLMKGMLIAEGVSERCVYVERDSVDTVTNIAFVEAGGYFQVDGAVAIVSQAGHLRRILNTIAPKLFKRPVIGVVAPEPEPPDHDSPWAILFSRIVLLDISPRTPRAAEITYRRACRLWRIARVFRLNRPYNQE